MHFSHNSKKYHKIDIFLVFNNYVNNSNNNNIQQIKNINKNTNKPTNSTNHYDLITCSTKTTLSN